jgi:simple sugar transport system permease protein
MLRLEPRPRSSALVQALTPVLAVAATMVAGGILFAALGKDPVEAIRSSTRETSSSAPSRTSPNP